jgi:hypothetical protein
MKNIKMPSHTQRERVRERERGRKEGRKALGERRVGELFISPRKIVRRK